MAEYINIKGQSIEVLASDPANPTLGQIWYNSTSNTLKGQGFGTASWATGSNLTTAREQLGSTGIQTAALAAGGEIAPAGGATTNSEEYDGSTWTAGGAIPIAVGGLGVSGTQNGSCSWWRRRTSRTILWHSSFNL